MNCIAWLDHVHMNQMFDLCLIRGPEEILGNHIT